WLDSDIGLVAGLSRVSDGSEDDCDGVPRAIIQKMNAAGGGRDNVDPQRRHTVRDTSRVLDIDAVHARAVAVLDGKTWPRRGNAGIEEQLVAALVEPKHALQCNAVAPACRTCIPGPATAALVAGDRVDVGGDDVRLDRVHI